MLGLKILDKLGTPVIVRTPWLYTDNDSIYDYWYEDG
ncbi:MAG: hypothetical protein [Bacteriophage sp.]|nr:MAG: hypothetical protein [Bacteriophage sp.]